jgi:hypothetical protein
MKQPAMPSARITWPDGRSLTVSLDALSDLSPGLLAGAVIQLVRRCPCCGACRAPSGAELELAAHQGGTRP